jgi:hypothetical protein
MDIAISKPGTTWIKKSEIHANAWEFKILKFKDHNKRIHFNE